MKGTTKDSSFKQGNKFAGSNNTDTIKLVLIGNTSPKLTNIYTGGNVGKTFSRSIGGRNVDVSLDIGGENYTDADTILLTFGYSTPTQSVKQDLKTWYNEAKRTAPKASVVLLGIKENTNSKTAVTNQDIQQLAKELHINTIAECTLDNPQSIVKAFDRAVTIGESNHQH